MKLVEMAPLVAALLATGCSGFSEHARATVHQSVAGVPAIVRVHNVAGTVRVDGSPRATVDVEATKFASDETELRSIHIDVRKEGNEVVVATTYQGTTRGGGVRYRITVPSTAAVRIDNVAGAVDVAGVSGDLSVETQAGRISADCGRADGNRSIDLDATTGAIDLTIARDSSATIDARSTVGHISSDLSEIVAQRENFVGASATGRIGTGSARIRLTTTTGAIALRTHS
ncbi:MAG TPA: DUF4097 family beta strand repeat-containing protein [Candidatus Baltobacteraceae bacterium]|jgi:DUF4097 and DUF4098 domain-containing protein YvlB|nr:DUF4097 family beta strand repeat-containing protein [Candidatus Baltobacteraceae bacterium]